MYIRWIPCPDKGVIFLSPKTIQNFKIKSGKITLHLGAWNKKLSIKPNEAIDENTIGLPDNLAEPYTIPGNLSYDIYLAGKDLHLGPVIAFFVREGWLSPKRIGRWKRYCQNYSQIGGLVYFCTIEGVDLKSKTISGYYFDPDVGKAGRLKPGVFPFPGVVYRRLRISMSILSELYKHVGNKIFNARIFNKWEMWTVLSKAGFTNTPFTTRLNGPDSLKKMLDLYSSIYLKPEIGRFGNGILKIEKTADGYILKEKSGITFCLEEFIQVFNLVQENKNKGNYIIQQAVPLNFKQNPIDFRVILQKDGSQKWTCSGVIAKNGLKGQIHTNNPSYIELGHDALQRIFELSPEEALEKENEIIRICTQACLLIERTYGKFGDVGIDVIVDENLKIWVLEINKSHQHDMARYLQDDDPDMYNRVVTRPLEYAKSLAGF